jgi:hypothetical protein
LESVPNPRFFGKKLPDLAALQSDFSRLTAEKERLSAEYKALKRQSREMNVIMSNVDSILKPTENALAKPKTPEL